MKTMNLIIFAFAISTLSLMANASPVTVCPPSFTMDGIEVTPGCPGLTYQVIVEPSTFLVALNDNPLSEGIASDGATLDADFNDGWITGLILDTSNPHYDAVYITWGGALSDWSNSISVGHATADAEHTSAEFAGLFAVGSTLLISATTGDGEKYYSNPNWNPGGVDHFYESQVLSDPLCNTPEPASLWFIGAGMVILGLFIKQQRG